MENIAEKLKGKGMGCVPDIINELRANIFLSKYDDFVKYINDYTRREIFIKQKLDYEEKEILWFMISRDTPPSKFKVIIRLKEIIPKRREQIRLYIKVVDFLIASISEPRGLEELPAAILSLLKSIRPDMEDIDMLIAKQIASLESGDLLSLLNEIKEEDDLVQKTSQTWETAWESIRVSYMESIMDNKEIKEYKKMQKGISRRAFFKSAKSFGLKAAGIIAFGGALDAMIPLLESKEYFSRYFDYSQPIPQFKYSDVPSLLNEEKVCLIMRGYPDQLSRRFGFDTFLGRETKNFYALMNIKGYRVCYVESNLLNIFGSIATALSASQKIKKFVFVYLGHGDEWGQLCIEEDRKKSLSKRQLLAILNKIICNKLIILGACHSGAIPDFAKSGFTQEVKDFKGTIIASSEPYEVSRDAFSGMMVGIDNFLNVYKDDPNREVDLSRIKFEEIYRPIVERLIWFLEDEAHKRSDYSSSSVKSSKTLKRFSNDSFVL
ncbi:MAG: hypothetical protein KJ922_04225 [Nanoarchaeota archaeon]|nr:hypothetical protein [Nanoarchaeota archaeon]MBU1704546.1 hypothetical protein [Nanoarchaeota archaeon]